MTCHPFVVRFARFAPRLVAAFCLLVAAAVSAAEAAKRTFDLPADTAERSLKRLAQQSGTEVVFVSEVTDGVRANPVKC